MNDYSLRVGSSPFYKSSTHFFLQFIPDCSPSFTQSNNLTRLDPFAGFLLFFFFISKHIYKCLSLGSLNCFGKLSESDQVFFPRMCEITHFRFKNMPVKEPHDSQ